MRIAYHFSISTVAFLIGLGSVPALAQTAANDSSPTARPGWTAMNEDTLQSSSIDRIVDRDLGQENQADIYNDRHTDTVASGASTGASGDLAQLGQNLQAENAKLEQDRTTERADFQKFRSDESAGDASAVQQDRANLIAQQQDVQTDRKAVDADMAASREALQPEIEAVQQDKSALRTDLQQTRTDRQDGDTSALQQDITNDQTARENLKTADTALQQDRQTVDLNNSRDAQNNGDRNQTGSGRDRFAFNGQESVATGDSGSTIVETTGTAAANASAQTASIGSTGGTNAWSGQTINTPAAIAGGSTAGTETTGTTTTAGTTTAVSAPVSAPVAPPHVAAMPHVIPHHR